MGRLNADFLSREALEALGFRSLGQDVLVHSTAVLVDCEKISLGSRIRIDPYVVISVKDGITIGDNVHLATHCSLMGESRIDLADFSNISQGVRVLSSSDDFKGNALMGPTVPQSFRLVRTAPVPIGRQAIVGAGSVILPGAILSEGVAVGALSLVSQPLEPWSIYAGAPIRRLGDRRRDVLSLEAAYLASM